MERVQGEVPAAQACPRRTGACPSTCRPGWSRDRLPSGWSAPAVGVQLQGARLHKAGVSTDCRLASALLMDDCMCAS